MAHTPIISFFKSKTCAPCRRLLPQVEALLEVEPFTLRVYDIDDHFLTAQQADVRAVPTLLFTSDPDEKLGKETDRLLPTQARLASILKKLEERHA